MNKRDAAKIAEYVTYYQLTAMFDNAKDNITDWQQVSGVNKNMTKGAAWNILYAAYRMMGECHLRDSLVKNMVWEFGDYLPEEAKLDKEGNRKSRAEIGPYHEDPVF